MPTAKSMGLRTLTRTSERPMAMPTITSGQAISPPTIPWERAAIRPACGAERFGPPKPPIAGVRRHVGLVQQVEREEEQEPGEDDADQVAHLHLPGRAAEDVADLQVLEHLARDRGGHADDRGDAEHGRDALDALDAHDHHRERRDDRGGQRESGDRVVRGADQADQVPGHGGEEEPRHQHHDRRQEGARQGPS